MSIDTRKYQPALVFIILGSCGSFGADKATTLAGTVLGLPQ